MINEIIQGSALENLEKLEANTIDLIVTDPPYGYSFMNKDWDKAVVPTDTWRECLRVLKPGAFAFIMSSPRQDVFCKMMLNLIEAGFRTDFSSIYWAYASGFPKAADVSKLVDKRYGRINSNAETLKIRLNELKESKGLSNQQMNKLCGFEAANYFRTDNHLINIFPQGDKWKKIKSILGDSSELDKELTFLFEQAEREIIAQKEKARSEGANYAMPTMGARTTYVNIDYTKPATEQAKQLEGSYAGFQPKPAVELILVVMKPLSEKSYVDQALANRKGITWLDSIKIPGSFEDGERFPANLIVSDNTLGEFSRYFSLEAWSKTLPFLLVPKPAKAEKGEFNKHPTVKSLKLMSYLITMGSREADTVLDPFCGSGTVLIAAHELHRKYIGIEISSEYCEIARERLRPHKEQKRIQEFTDA